MREIAHQHTRLRANWTQANRHAGGSNTVVVAATELASASSQIDSDLQDIGAPYVKGHDPKITLSRDKSFFRSASVTNSPPTPLKIPNMILGGAVGGVISILFCK